MGNSVTGKTEQEIADLINEQVDNTAVRAKYQGQSATFTLKDLGIEVDGEAIASDVINAQRGDAWWQQYAFWITHDVAPQINPELADGSVVDKALNIDAQEPVDAQVALNDNNSGFNVIVGENGQEPTPPALRSKPFHSGVIGQCPATDRSGGTRRNRTDDYQCNCR